MKAPGVDEQVDQVRPSLWEEIDASEVEDMDTVTGTGIGTD